MYSKACIDIASLGFVVVALEHEDGTASYAKPEGASERLPYRGPPKGFEYERDNVIEFREPFLEHRMGEVSAALAFMRKGAVTDAKMEPHSDLARLESVFARVDRDNFWLAGHSFGGTSTVVASQQPWAADAQGFVLLDVWPFPVPREIAAEGFSKPVLSILSDEFASGREVALTYDMFANSSTLDKHNFYIPGTRHQQFSDFAFAMRGFMLRVSKVCGFTTSEESQRAIFAALSGFLSRSNGDYDPESWAEEAVRSTALEFTPKSLL
ncbi:Platelet-activating factor acetylhydrolase [Hondaea fermentalgiana]|uniref:1-alkyl-2-acetylglycerophosphocholine esterase n=1 Tax=Hondaea fermentalgiana TaxID=2315210 RepID=A0A2R5GVE4_9STRA|nr:Platelet-activating factor acetylhydrolase [Hondaea fermentalgiana]|eukprot:GBG34820.1 Platelet-activating factor acetylhydrolase [Hondaea fermentalgiana]